MIMMILVILLYLLPTFVACSLAKKHTIAIFFLNLLLGWTYLGWVIALVWAIADEKDKKCRK